ncbi:MAG: serine hydroxymethyltransferase [Planctomycetota bacterium]|nr:serine hydroxymethyltransferase [Planctomycetota bacterium]
MQVETKVVPSDVLKRVRETVDANDRWRSQTINLIASENVLSPAARSVLDSDLQHRYAEGHPGGRYYEGTKYIDVIETLAREAMERVFQAGWADVRPISGTVANEAVFSRIVPQGSPAIAHTVAGGGHISHARIGALGKRTKNILSWPMQADGYTIDVDAARDLINTEKPSIVVLGRSLFLFPEPVAELRDVCRENGTRMLYDGAHVLGLIAAGTFQDPLREGADVLNGSTHKTFFGSQRGVMLTNGEDDKLNNKLDKGVFPGSSSNHHLFSLPALLVSALEVEAFGSEYAKATIGNAQALGASLAKRGFVVSMPERGYSASHQVAVDVAPYGGGKDVSARWCEQDIVCNMNLLPGEPGKNAFNPRGVRLGVQEMTRFGMGPDEMDVIADLMHASVEGTRDVRDEVKALRARFPEVRYGFKPEDLS